MKVLPLQPGFCALALSGFASFCCLLSGCGKDGPSNAPYVDNVTADTSLAKYVGTQVAKTPGKLAFLPVGSAGSVQKRGYVEYVPPEYASGNGWPVIINLHGDGELGDGKTVAALQPFAYSCLPAMIDQDNWDKNHRFVVLSPQFASYDDRKAANVREFIQFAKANYRIDVNRIYLTAVSGGGVALGDYLATYSGGEAAAVLPISCYVPPIGSSAKWKSVPVWFMSGAADSTVRPANLAKNYRALLTPTAPDIPPKMTLYTGIGHEGASATKSYSPASMDNHFETSFDGIPLVPYDNIYDWLLQYHR